MAKALAVVNEVEAVWSQAIPINGLQSGAQILAGRLDVKILSLVQGYCLDPRLPL